MELAEQDNRPFYVQFETRAVENKRKSLAEGHIVYDDVDFVMVTLPGGRDVFENRYEAWIDQQEAYVRRGKQSQENVDLYKKAYKAFSEGKEIPLEGTPVRGWQAVTPAQMKTILGAGYKTVEDLAKANDEGLRRLGMGGRALIEKAKSWIDAASSHGKVAMENAELKKQVQNMETTINSLENTVNQLKEALEQKAPGLVSEPNFMDMKDEDINLLYEKKFGKPPHHMMKEETIRKKLEE